MTLFSKFFKASEPDLKTNQNCTTSANSKGRTATPKTRCEAKIFRSAQELVAFFDAEFKTVSDGLVFEQGGFLAKGPRGWELYVPKKIVGLKATSDIDKFSDINFGFYGQNRAGEEGILLKVSQRIPAYIDSVFKQASDKMNGTALLETAFFTADRRRAGRSASAKSKTNPSETPTHVSRDGGRPGCGCASDRPLVRRRGRC